MPDAVPCHTAKYVKEWLGDCEVKDFKDWPGSSPDFYSFESLWSRATMLSVPKLKATIPELWNNLPQDLMQNLATSVPGHPEKCLMRKDAVTKCQRCSEGYLSSLMMPNHIKAHFSGAVGQGILTFGLDCISIYACVCVVFYLPSNVSHFIFFNTWSGMKPQTGSDRQQ